MEEGDALQDVHLGPPTGRHVPPRLVRRRHAQERGADGDEVGARLGEERDEAQAHVHREDGVGGDVEVAHGVGVGGARLVDELAGAAGGAVEAAGVGCGGAAGVEVLAGVALAAAAGALAGAALRRELAGLARGARRCGKSCMRG